MKTRIIASLSLFALLASCNTTTVQKDYIIFGDYYGFCMGPGCVDYFKIEDGVLYGDIMDQYPSSTMAYHFETYTNSFPSSILDLSAEIPSAITSEAETIGMPDTYDQGGYYLEISNGGNIQRWKIDKNLADVPVYLHAVCDSMQYYLDVLQ